MYVLLYVLNLRRELRANLMRQIEMATTSVKAQLNCFGIGEIKLDIFCFMFNKNSLLDVPMAAAFVMYA